MMLHPSPSPPPFDAPHRREAGGAPPLCMSIAHDADEHARNLHGWHQTYDQLSAGRFTGTLVELFLDRMTVFRETTSHTLRQSCEVKSDAYWFGIPVCEAGAGRIDGQPIGEDALALRPGGVEFELFTPAHHEFFGIVVKGEVLRRYAAEVEHLGLGQPLPGASVVPIGSARKARLVASLRAILDESARRGAPPSPFLRNQLQSSVLAALFDLCVAPQRTDSESIRASTYRRRLALVMDARDYAIAHRDRPIGVPELCEHLHVSRRTLQYCFQDVAGLAPAAYLRALRLNGARRDLTGAAQAAPHAASVQDIATAWGFWHFSQFSADYRRLFGVRPSDSLKHANPPV
ncbi:AraC family transcriptional regulator [Trinickia dabaoshanensis]|uniref:AraC family transcriptional regulator n=1 Tax=Trinickia dabaoshanensis TaxID=564714 RepID=A0A2N7VBY5_9BURK|nr:AraC family transcriptional regulator [Trinickia dabaoshanensis]